MLKELREKAGLTQAELAEKFGYSTPQFISNIERGRAMLPVAQYPKAAKILGVSVNRLIEHKIAHTRKILRKALRV